MIDAQQYLVGSSVPGVTERPAELVFSASGKHFYLSAAFDRLADCWLPVEEGGEAFPFSMYEIKIGERRAATPDDPLTKRYLSYLKVEAIPDPYAFVTTAHGDKTRVVSGDWIIPEPDGRGYYPCKPDIFEATYEAV